MKRKVPPSYSRADDGARSLYGRRDDGVLKCSNLILNFMGIPKFFKWLQCEAMDAQRQQALGLALLALLILLLVVLRRLWSGG